MRKLGLVGLLRLLIRALQAHAAQHGRVADQLQILNGHVSRIWPAAPVPAPLGPELPDAEVDDFYSLVLANDAELQLRLELGRDPSVDEVSARLAAWRDRRRVDGRVEARRGPL